MKIKWNEIKTAEDTAGKNNHHMTLEGDKRRKEAEKVHMKVKEGHRDKQNTNQETITPGKN